MPPASQLSNISLAAGGDEDTHPKEPETRKDLQNWWDSLISSSGANGIIPVDQQGVCIGEALPPVPERLVQNPNVVQEYLVKECVEGRILGPLPVSDFPMVHISRFGVIPKGSSGKWHLIVDLLAPEEHSVTDRIREDLCSLKYVLVDNAVQAVLRLGWGAQLAKVDIRSAYWIILVHTEDRWLLGMSWAGELYIDTALPFGLRLAPKIFNAVADTVEWIIQQQGVDPLFHYLDDFLLVGLPGSGQCATHLSIAVSVCPSGYTSCPREG